MGEHISLRKTFGETLEKIGGKAKTVVVLDSDLNNHLYTLHFAKNFPERHFTLENGESSMLAMGAGMATRKKIPIICAEAAPLLGKGLDMLRNAIIGPNLNVKIVLSNIGLGNIENGVARTSTEDLSLLQTFPELKILTPADQFELKSMLEFIINDYGPTVLRLSRHCGENIFDNNFSFINGEPVVVRRGEKICLITAGCMLHQAMKAASELEQRALSVSVVNLSSLPVNEQKLAEICRNFEMIVTIEEHNVHGGLGTLVTEILYRNEIYRKIIKLGLTGLPEPGKFDDLIHKYGLSSKSIYETVRENWLKL